MSLIALILLPFLAASASALPLDYAVGDVGYGYDAGYGGYGFGGLGGLGYGFGGLGGLGYGFGGLGGLGYGFGYGGLGGLGYGFGYGGLGYGYGGYGYAPALASDYLDAGYPDYGYWGSPRTVDYARENFVRGNYFGATEVGTRDEVTIRPSYWGAPYSRFYPSYFPFNFYRGFNRFPFYGGGGYPLGRVSTLGRVAGDTVYLKR